MIKKVDEFNKVGDELLSLSRSYQLTATELGRVERKKEIATTKVLLRLCERIEKVREV